MKIRQAQQNAKKEKNVPKSFFNKKIDLNNYTSLSESLEKTLFLGSFILFPYLTGVIFSFFFFAHTNLEYYSHIDITKFMFLWTIGYELLALIILILIFKSAMNFKDT